ncbi:hypothetical protein [Caballeronia sp. LZ001]|uniref:hypothetical protein n=1 Tax=Caballeronia sp. LZ001 TaxID=3038553 RepID=UPI00285ABC0A|nr:hypothetical protein [Caballeronia sp. LZ001]MDR5805526.1 hypothetical protein [Caballeronia sp. LZ001]
MSRTHDLARQRGYDFAVFGFFVEVRAQAGVVESVPKLIGGLPTASILVFSVCFPEPADIGISGRRWVIMITVSAKSIKKEADVNYRTAWDAVIGRISLRVGANRVQHIKRRAICSIDFVRISHSYFHLRHE